MECQPGFTGIVFYMMAILWCYAAWLNYKILRLRRAEISDLRKSLDTAFDAAVKVAQERDAELAQQKGLDLRDKNQP